MLTSWIIVAFMIVLVFFATRRWEMVPRGIQNAVEAAVEAFYNLVVGVAGESKTDAASSPSSPPSSSWCSSSTGSRSFPSSP